MNNISRWSVWILKHFPNKNNEIFHSHTRRVSNSFSIWLYLCWVGVKETEAYSIGWFSWAIKAPISGRLASTVITVTFPGGKYDKRGVVITCCFKWSKHLCSFSVRSYSSLLLRSLLNIRVSWPKCVVNLFCFPVETYHW